ncbi:hypothetical protein AOQ84DRAFT_400357 [Glonium stellatum]|uniref:DUF7702 domain-containing protein n=1 Tax=Glonium stellatum TaxID=574774 RepID=A0A8E2ESA4_9PEZI|nr:hypothetical protein AOQ84DRAFT_400357 [Glonium stellatum]
MLSSKESLAIAQLVIYIPVLFASTIVVTRHGFHRQLGWIFLAILATIRIIGSGFEIAAVKNPHNSTDIEWAAILQSVGISPLLLASLGLLKRIIDETAMRALRHSGVQIPLAAFSVIGQLSRRFTKKAPASTRRGEVIQLLYLPCTIGLILCIVGGTDLASAKLSDQHSGMTLFKAGIILFVVVYAALFLITIITAQDFNHIVPREQRVFLAVLAALPLLGARIVYGMLCVFLNDKTFSIFGRNIVARVLMAVLEEFLVVIAYTFVGLTAPKIGEGQVDSRT